MTDHKQTEKPDPKRMRVDFYRLAVDWVHLHTQLPRPVAEKSRPSKYRSYGHPAQWASDKAAQIADMFFSWHDMVAEDRCEKMPREDTSEYLRVYQAWKYLEPRMDHLAGLVTKDDLREIVDVHREIRRALGYNNPKQALPIPCPRCELRTLARTIAVGKDYISCGNPDCGYSVSDVYYPLLVRMALDTLIESA